MSEVEVGSIGQLKTVFRSPGRVQWIGLRPGRQQPVVPVDECVADPDRGLAGDHFSGGAGSKRQVTLIQAEHLQVVAQLLDLDPIDPGLVRRNLVVAGINLVALKERPFSVGEAILQFTGLCHPCSRMEQNLGAGGYNARRGHGGITATILRGGVIRLGDEVLPVDDR